MTEIAGKRRRFGYCQIVHWRVSRTVHAGIVLDVLEHAVHQRRLETGGGIAPRLERDHNIWRPVTPRPSDRRRSIRLSPSAMTVSQTRGKHSLGQCES